MSEYVSLDKYSEDIYMSMCHGTSCSLIWRVDKFKIKEIFKQYFNVFLNSFLKYLKTTPTLTTLV